MSSIEYINGRAGVDRSRLDIDGLHSLLKNECVACNFWARHNLSKAMIAAKRLLSIRDDLIEGKGEQLIVKYDNAIKFLKKVPDTKCPDCNFVAASTTSMAKDSAGIIKRCRTGLGRRFANYGIVNPNDFGKYQLMYFLYYSWLDFRWPVIDPIGTLDVFGNEITEDTQWHIHHMDGVYFNDSRWNLLLCYNSEHQTFERKFGTNASYWEKIQLIKSHQVSRIRSCR